MFPPQSVLHGDVLATFGGIAGIGLGNILGREHDSTPQSGVEAPRLSKRSLSPDCILVVEWFIFFKKQVLIEELTLREKKNRQLAVVKCVFFCHAH